MAIYRTDYYSMPDSNYNILKDTLFSNSTLRFFDTTTSAIVQNSDNKVVITNKKIPTSAYESFTSLVVRPPPKKIVADTLDMSVVPSQDYVNISSISKNFDSYSKPKKWTETSPYPDITSDVHYWRLSTQYPDWNKDKWIILERPYLQWLGAYIFYT